ncbi:Fic family protein [Azospirillum sp. YIM DDC1]|uniref:Fic family protein n=1 Tax=Azospirillum aestuarii TaxID=2802052 RepID=A0ABS1I811_9PROT|nr:Fic family protein [Azospirillum aestuarii]
MVVYIWQRDEWPSFRWDGNRLLSPLARARHRQGFLLGKMSDIGFAAQREAELAALSEDVVKTSAIEGEVLDPASVRSSVARRLGLSEAGPMLVDRRVEGVVGIVMDASSNHVQPLTEERLHGWHAALFPTGRSGGEPIDVARWRTDRLGAMQVVSNPFSPRPTVHYEAPPARRVASEMAAFLRWFNAGREIDPLLRAGLAHLWFVTIHPMDDGNGRIARVVADLAMAQAEGTRQRFYSLSAAIERDRTHYYNALEAAQKGDLDITDWLVWFAECCESAIQAAEAMTERVVNTARFWKAHAAYPFSGRQRQVLGKLLEGCDGPITARKWTGLCGCSPDTAQRDMSALVGLGLLARNPGSGRSTSYRFNWPPIDGPSVVPEGKPPVTGQQPAKR